MSLVVHAIGALEMTEPSNTVEIALLSGLPTRIGTNSKLILSEIVPSHGGGR